jgi:hypothetical protein
MADTKISALTAASSLGDTDELVLASAGTNKKITGANLKASTSLALLSSTTLASPGTFDITGIPQTYNDLIVVLIARDTGVTGNVAPEVRVNADAGTNYSNERYSVTGTAAVSGAETTGSSFCNLGNLPGASAGANLFGTIEATFHGYASTAWAKTYQARSFYPVLIQAGGLNIREVGGIWNSTAAINRFSITGNAGANFVAGSQLRIYGRL